MGWEKGWLARRKAGDEVEREIGEGGGYKL